MAIPDVVLIFTAAHIPDVVLCSLSLEWCPFINTCEVFVLISSHDPHGPFPCY